MFGRGRTMSPEQQAAFRAELEKLDDWVGICRICKKERKGTLAELRKPCGCENGPKSPDSPSSS